MASCGKLAFSYFAGGNVKWVSHCRTQSVTQKRKHRIILWSHSRTPRHIPKRNENEHSDACPCIFIAASFTTAKGRTRQMPISRGLGKQAMACTYDRWLLSHKTKRSSDTNRAGRASHCVSPLLPPEPVKPWKHADWWLQGGGSCLSGTGFLWGWGTR